MVLGSMGVNDNLAGIMRWILAILFCCLPALVLGQDVTVSAAISLKETIGQVADQYQKEAGKMVRLNFGASGDLANQIVAGAPVDLFISAGREQIGQLQRAKLVDGKPVVIARNQLVLIAPMDSHEPREWNDLPGLTHICVGDPKSVPAGKYAMQVLDHFALAPKLAGKLIYAANVRQVLAYVERGEVDAGLVYSTDAKQGGIKVRIVATAPENSHEPIEYPAVKIVGGHPKAAEAFLKFLTAPDAQKILQRYGFEKGSP